MGGAALRSIERQVNDFMERMAKEFNSVVRTVNVLRDGTANLTSAISETLRGIKSNMDHQSNALETFDVYNQTFGRMLLRLTERVVQLETILRHRYIEISELSPSELEGVKTEAETLFNDLFNETKERILEERRSYIEEMRKKVAEEEAKKEQKIAEDALLDVGKASLADTVPDSPVQYPEGAELFGG